MAIAETPDLQLPYPDPGTGEPNNVPLHMKQLAERLEQVLPVAIAAAVSDLVDGAPGALDTLNELAAALGDDPNYAATITTKLARLPLNLLNYAGATGDGTTDDTAAFTALNADINALKSVAHGFDIVIPDRAFVTSEGIVLDGVTNATVTIRGSVKMKSGVLGGSSQVSLVDIKGSSSRIHVTGPGLLDGNRAGQSGYSEFNMGVKIVDSSAVRITGLDIKNTAGDNVYVRGSSWVQIAGNRFTDPNTGGVGGARQGVAVVGGCSDIEIIDNRFWSATSSLVSGRMAIDIEPDSGNVDRVLVRGNIVQGSEWNRALSARSLAIASISRLRIIGNDFSRFVFLDATAGGSVADVEIVDNTIDGSIVCKSVTGTLHVRGNTTRRQDIDGIKSALIYFSACSYVLCHDNIVKPVAGASATKGIWNEGATTYLSILGNLLVSQGGASMTGIDLDGAVQICNIDGNIGVGNAGTPMPVGIDLSGLSGQSHVKVGAHNHFTYQVTSPISGQSKALGAAMLNGRSVREGGNDSCMGVATLVAGTVTVTSSKVTANSRIHLTIQSLGTVTSPKAVAVTARSVSNNFTITSADATDTSVVAWEIVEPA